MLQASHTKAMGRTSITNSPSPKVALIVGLISGWSRKEQIAVLHETLMALSKAKPLNEKKGENR